MPQKQLIISRVKQLNFPYRLEASGGRNPSYCGSLRLAMRVSFRSLDRLVLESENRLANAPSNPS